MMELLKVPEDTVSFKLFLNNDVDLDSARTNLISSVSNYLLDHLWQNESFSLEISDASLTEPDHLFGNLNFGDNIEDEWFVIFLLLKMTEVDKNLVVKVNDNDGEFLLIEAANHLPKWLGPETSENRVWLHRGKVHIIPQPSTERDACLLPLYAPSVEDALKCVRCHGDLTEANEAVQNAIQERIKIYPAHIYKQQHRTNVEIPLSAAAVFKQDRQLVSTAVHAFYYRDPLDVRACRTLEYFPPEELVSWQVILTRCMYAQLMQQQFTPDRRSGWNMLPATSPGAKARDLGMKLSHGLEIMCRQFRGSKTGADTSSTPEIVSSFQWDRFVRRLESLKYFEGELEGSKKYKEKLKIAKTFFIDCIENQSEQEEPATRILRMRHHFLENKTEYEQEILDEVINLPPEDGCSNSGDSWMTMTPEEFDAMMDEKTQRYFAAGRQTAAPAPDVAVAMRQFVESKSSVDGVETPTPPNPVVKRISRDRTPCSARSSECRDEEEVDEEVKLEVGGILQSMNELLNLDGDDGMASDDSDIAEYSSSPSEDEGDRLTDGVHPESAASRTTRMRHTQALRGEVNAMQSYMRQMDDELRQTGAVAAGGARAARARLAMSEDLDSDDLSEEETCQDVRANLTKSLEAQAGGPGPAGTILGEIGAAAACSNSNGYNK